MEALDQPYLKWYGEATRGADRAAGALLTGQVRVDENLLRKRRDDAMSKVLTRIAEMEAEDAAKAGAIAAP